MDYSDPYEALGLPPNATQDEIKRKFYQLCKEHHPDLNALTWRQEFIAQGLEGEALTHAVKRKLAESVRRMQRLNAAYEELSGKAQRQAGPLYGRVRYSDNGHVYANPFDDPEFVRDFEKFLKEELQRMAAADRARALNTTFWWENRKYFLISLGVLALIWLGIFGLGAIIFQEEPPWSMGLIYAGTYIAAYTSSMAQLNRFRGQKTTWLLWIPTFIMTGGLLIWLALAVTGPVFFLSLGMIITIPFLTSQFFYTRLERPFNVWNYTILATVLIISLLISILVPFEARSWISAWIITIHGLSRGSS
jgi:hypothetical protein